MQSAMRSPAIYTTTSTVVKKMRMRQLFTRAHAHGLEGLIQKGWAPRDPPPSKIAKYCPPDPASLGTVMSARISPLYVSVIISVSVSPL
jgi:hypothetical protein